MKSFQLPLVYDALPRRPLAPEDPSARPTAHFTDPCCRSPSEPDTGDSGQPKGYLLALVDPEIPFAATLQGYPLLEPGCLGEAFHSPSSPEEDPPKTNSVKKGYDPNYKIYALLTAR